MKKSNKHYEHRPAAKEESSLARTLAFSLISGGIGAVTTVILIIVCTFTAISKDDPDKLISVFGIVIPALSYLLAGYVSYRLSRRAPLVCGAVCAATLMLLIKLFSFIFKSGNNDSFSIPIKAVLCALYVFLSILGAIIAANLSNSAKKGRKKRR